MKPVKNSPTRTRATTSTTATTSTEASGNGTRGVPGSIPQPSRQTHPGAVCQDEPALVATGSTGSTGTTGSTSSTGQDAASGRSNSERPERSIHSANGAKGGRPMREVDMDEVRRLRAEGKSVKSISRLLFVGEGTLRRRLGLMYGGRAENASTPRQKPLGGGL